MTGNVQAMPKLTSLGKPLDVSPAAFGELRDATGLLAEPQRLRNQMDEHGYLLLRGLLDRDEVLACRREMVARLQRQGSLQPGTDPMDAITRRGEHPQLRVDLAKDNAPMMQVLYSGAMVAFFERFLGGPILHYDFTWVRCIPPGTGTAPHYDVVYMGRGTKRLYTAWTPMGDIDYQQGGLLIMENSHRNERLKQGYGSRDVDVYCVNKPDQNLTAYGDNGWLSQDPVRLRRGMKARWLTSEFQAGDAVIFGMYLVHGSLDNHSDRFRLSTDSRYQLASEPADERWIGPNPPGHSRAGKRGRVC